MVYSAGNNISWSKTASKRTGLHTNHSYFTSTGISVHLNGMYYFGDADNEGLIFHGGFNAKNLCMGGGVDFIYNIPGSDYCNLRFGINTGTLRSDNTALFNSIGRTDYRKFHSWFLQPAAGVEYYPIKNVGFYLYGGVAFTISFIDPFEYYYERVENGVKSRILLEGKTYGLLPTLQAGLGYSWRLADGWIMSAEVMGQLGIVDTHFMNLDAYPMAASQNSENIAMGGSHGTWIDSEGNKHTRWNDGWFQIGLSVSYRWDEGGSSNQKRGYGGYSGKSKSKSKSKSYGRSSRNSRGRSSYGRSGSNKRRSYGTPRRRR